MFSADDLNCQESTVICDSSLHSYTERTCTHPRPRLGVYQLSSLLLGLLPVLLCTQLCLIDNHLFTNLANPFDVPQENDYKFIRDQSVEMFLCREGNIEWDAEVFESGTDHVTISSCVEIPSLYDSLVAKRPLSLV